MDNIVNTGDIVADLGQAQITGDRVDPVGPITGPIQQQRIEQSAPAAQKKPVEAAIIQQGKVSFWNRVGSLKNSPWLLLSGFVVLVAVVGGIWLGNNFGIITNNLNQPYTMLAAPATIVTIVAIWLLFNFFKVIVSTFRALWFTFQAWRQKPGSVFWMVITVFLVVSVLESGTFFNELLGPNSLYGALGYASAFVIDLVSVECMRARQRAVRRRDEQGERLFQLGVVVCALISAFGNGYIALEHFVDPVHTQIPEWMIHVAPLVGVIFPLLMVFLSFAGDYTSAQDSSSLNPEEFAASEASSLRFIEIQRDSLARKVELENQMIRLTAKAGKVKRVFFLIRWLFPKDHLSMPLVVENTMQEMKKFYDPQIQMLVDRNQILETQLLQITANAKQSYQDLERVMQQQFVSINGQKDADMSLISQQFTNAQKHFSELLNQSKDETITLLQIRFNTTINALQEEQKNILQQSIYNQGQTHFEEARKHQLYDAQNTVQNENKEEGKTKKVGRQAGYQIENDPEAISLLSAYPNLQAWMDRSAKSATLDEIVTATGHSRKMVVNRISDGTLRKTKNQNYMTAESIIKWLLKAPLPRSKNDVSSEDKEIGKVDDDTSETIVLSEEENTVLGDDQTEGCEVDTDESSAVLIEEENKIADPELEEMIA